MSLICIESGLEIRAEDGGFYAIMHPVRQQLFAVSKASMDRIDDAWRKNDIEKIPIDVDVYVGTASETHRGNYIFADFGRKEYLFSIPRTWAERMFPKLFELT